MPLFRQSVFHVAVVLGLFLGTAVAARAQTPPCTHYASPTGTGNGLSQSSPFKIQNFWAVAGPGKTLCLLDGRYTGSENMILPTGSNGTASAPITVRALNDGKVLIDGEFVRNPIYVVNSSYIVIEGMDAKRPCGAIAPNNSHHITFRRIVAHDGNFEGATCAGGPGLIGVYYSNNILYEDVAAFGPSRKVLGPVFGSPSHSNVFRRVWTRWEGSAIGGNKFSASVTYQRDPSPGPGSIFENVISTWSGESTPESYDHENGRVTNFAAPGSNWLFGRDNLGETADGKPVCRGLQVLGSLTYVRSTTVAPPGGPVRHVSIGDNNGTTNIARIAQCYIYKDILAFHHPSHVGFPGMRGFIFGSAGTNNVAENLTSVAGNTDIIPSNWSPRNNVHVTGASISAVQTALQNAGANPWTGTKGANLCYRYENGVKTAKPLWPWPMNERIKKATQEAGSYNGPCPNCVGGRFARTATDVQADIESLLGPIPAQCRSTSVTPPPPPPPPPAPSPTPPPPPSSSTAFKPGDRVVVNESGPASVREAGSPSAAILGYQPVGSFGTVVGGPATVDGGIVWWWQVNYDNAPDGWTYEERLDLAPSSGASGDLNFDGKVDASDLQLEVNVILGTETNSAIRSRADLNGDGAVNALDLQRLVNLILGL